MDRDHRRRKQQTASSGGGTLRERRAKSDRAGREKERERETERLMGRDKQTHKIRANNGGADKDKETLYHSPVVSQEAPIREKMKVC